MNKVMNISSTNQKYVRYDNKIHSLEYQLFSNNKVFSYHGYDKINNMNIIWHIVEYKDVNTEKQNIVYYVDAIKIIEKEFNLSFIDIWIDLFENYLNVNIITIKDSQIAYNIIKNRVCKTNNNSNNNNSNINIQSNVNDCNVIDSSNTGIRLPDLKARLRNNIDCYEDILMNTSKPIRFITDVFEGEMMMLINSPKETNKELNNIFLKDNYKFQIQIQGKFKIIPNGIIFIGAEVTKKMDLGLVTYGISNTLLKLCHTTNPYMHYSFGSSNNSSSNNDINFELPHITAPIWSAVDRLVITKPNETPPSFKEIFPEDLIKRKQRRNNPDYQEKINLDYIYSFSFKTTKLDLEQWKVVNIPYIRPMNLTTFWGNADLRLIIYYIPTNIASNLKLYSNGLPSIHPHKYLKYLFSLEIQHILNHSDLDNHKSTSDYQKYTFDSKHYNSSNHTLINEYQGLTYSNNSTVSMDSDVDSDDFYEAYDGLGTNNDEFNNISTVNNNNIDNTIDNNDISNNNNDQRDISYSNTDYSIQSFGNIENSFNYLDQDISIDTNIANTTITPIHSPIEKNNKYLTTQISSSVSINNTRNSLFNTNNGKNINDLMDISILAKVFKKSSVIAAIEVNQNNFKRRRILYAFSTINTLNNITTTTTNNNNISNTTSSTSKQYILRSYGEWLSHGLIIDKKMIQEKVKSDLSYQRLSEINKRRIQLAISYDYIIKLKDTICNKNNTNNADDKYNGMLFTLLESYLNDLTHTNQFLLPIHHPHNKQQQQQLVDQCAIPIYIKTNTQSSSTLIKEGYVAVQESNYFWSEEYMLLTEHELLIVRKSNNKNQYIKRTNMKVLLSLIDIIYVRPISESDNPLSISCCYSMVISTFAKQYIILINGLNERNKWIYLIQNQIKLMLQLSNLNQPLPQSLLPHSIHSNVISMSSNNSYANFNNVNLISYPNDWNLGSKMILNGRCYTCNGIYYQLNTRSLYLGNLVKDPCQLVKNLLNMIFEITEYTQRYSYHTNVCIDETDTNNIIDPSNTTITTIPSTTSTSMMIQNLWITYMDGISLLQCIDISSMDTTSNDMLCMFLNLYHCLLLHSYLVVGHPHNLMQWSSFYSYCSYEAFGDIFSLSELEHCIIRNGMPKPQVNFIAQLFIPSIKFNFGLNIYDYRLFWATYCSAITDFNQIPIFKSDLLDEQLECIISMNLKEEIKIKSNNIILLPIYIQWYYKLFIKEEALLHTSNIVNKNSISCTYINVNEQENSSTSSSSILDQGNNDISERKLLLLALLKHLSGDLKKSIQNLIDQKKTYSFKYKALDFTSKYPMKMSLEYLTYWLEQGKNSSNN